MYNGGVGVGGAGARWYVRPGNNMTRRVTHDSHRCQMAQFFFSFLSSGFSSRSKLLRLATAGDAPAALLLLTDPPAPCVEN